MQTFRRIRSKAARSRIRVPRAWFWHLGLRPVDVFLASYPRSGSTWLRFILFEILTGKDAGFQGLEKWLPEVSAHRGVPPILPGGGRLIKTHEKYRKDYGRAVFLVRDVRDVLLYIYVGSVQLGTTSLVSGGDDLDSFLLSFLQGKALQVGSWQEHTRSWLESPLANNGNLMVVRYEDLRQNPEQIVGQMLQFIGITPDVRMIRKAIENNTLQQMRAKEDHARRTGEHSDLLFSRKSASEDGRFIRQGTIGGWRSKLTDAQLKIIWEYAGGPLAAAGYEPRLEEAVR